MKSIKRIIAIAMMALAVGVSAEEKVTSFEFATDPGIKTSLSPIPGHREKLMSTSFAIPPTNGKTVAIEFELDIRIFNHYAPLYIGIGNGKGQKLEFSFIKTDDRINRCNLTAQAVPGLGLKLKPFNNIVPGKMTASILYNAAKREVSFMLRSMDGKELFKSKAAKIMGKLNLNQFYVGVGQTADEASEISYDPDARALFFRSYVGVEGEYPYVLQGFVDNVTVSSEQ